MGIYEKQKERLRSCPKDFTFDEAKSLLEHSGYRICGKGKTSGSRVTFINPNNGDKISFHKPHPQNAMKEYALRQIIDKLTAEGLL